MESIIKGAKKASFYVEYTLDNMIKIMLSGLENTPIASRVLLSQIKLMIIPENIGNSILSL
jgi:hypothetical protein